MLSRRDHVKSDIQPYVCLLENCPSPSDLYSIRNDWLHHMRQKHGKTQYACFAPIHTRGAQFFDTKAAYEDHMRREHPGTFTESHLAILVEKSVYRTPLTPLFETCPICPGPVPESTQDQERKSIQGHGQEPAKESA